VLKELSTLTPQEISIESFDSDFTKGTSEKRSVLIKGIVEDDFTDLESTLTGYVIKLGDSPLFGDILLQDKKIEKNESKSILKFTAEMEIL
jgi:hypothetical protein